VTVAPGFALDQEGREILVCEPRQLALPDRDEAVSICVLYREVETERGTIRETCELVATTTPPDDAVVLGVVEARIVVTKDRPSTRTAMHDGSRVLPASEEAEQLRGLSRDAFKREIRGLDDETLADLRYEFGWDPQDPAKSAWQTRTINRLLTSRKDRRAARPQWVGIAVSASLGLAALIVALVR
jgi:hypothetical protein